MSVTKVTPIEDYVFAGFQQRFQQQFDCPVIYTTSSDKTHALSRLLNGKPVTYPYAFMTVQNIGFNRDSYSSNWLARRGLISTVDANNVATRVRLMPANFDLEIEYVTNKFQSGDQGSALAFVRRWMFASRAGYLKFNVKYGSITLGISATLSDQPPIPLRENATENETSFKITTNVTLHGYVSEPVLGGVGIVSDVIANGVNLSATDSSGTDFFDIEATKD